MTIRRDRHGKIVRITPAPAPAPKRISVYDMRKVIYKTVKQRYWHKRKDGVKQRYWRNVKRRMGIGKPRRFDLHGSGKELYKAVLKIKGEKRFPKKRFTKVSASVFIKNADKYSTKELDIECDVGCPD